MKKEEKKNWRIKYKFIDCLLGMEIYLLCDGEKKC